MALIFGRYDKADEQVREAIVELVKNESEQQSTAAALVLLELAVNREPDVTVRDLRQVVCRLVGEAFNLRFFGKAVQPERTGVRFEAYLLKAAGTPDRLGDGSAHFLTLAEIDTLLAGRHQKSEIHGVQGESRWR